MRFCFTFIFCITYWFTSVLMYIHTHTAAGWPERARGCRSLPVWIFSECGCRSRACRRRRRTFFPCFSNFFSANVAVAAVLAADADAHSFLLDIYCFLPMIYLSLPANVAFAAENDVLSFHFFFKFCLRPTWTLHRCLPQKTTYITYILKSALVNLL